MEKLIDFIEMRHPKNLQYCGQRKFQLQGLTNDCRQYISGGEDLYSAFYGIIGYVEKSSATQTSLDILTQQPDLPNAFTYDA